MNKIFTFKDGDIIVIASEIASIEKCGDTLGEYNIGIYLKSGQKVIAPFADKKLRRDMWFTDIKNSMIGD